jgi:hypothetical protein
MNGKWGSVWELRTISDEQNTDIPPHDLATRDRRS